MKNIDQSPHWGTIQMLKNGMYDAIRSHRANDHTCDAAAYLAPAIVEKRPAQIGVWKGGN